MTVVPGIVLGGAAVPTDSADTYPVTDPQWGLGGCRTVATTAERNAIPVPRLQKGMLVFVTTDGNTYRLKLTWAGGPTTDADWEIAIGVGGGLTGSGIAESVAYWNTPTSIAADSFFKYSFATEILQTKRGLTFYEYDFTTTRYVDTLGSDTNDGLSPATAWSTIGYALNQCLIAGPGKYTINVAPGAYDVYVDIPEFIGRANDPIAKGSLIEIIGDETTPSLVVFNSTSTSIKLNCKSTILRIAGVSFAGDGTNTCVLQLSGALFLRNVTGDNFQTFIRAYNGSILWAESSALGISVSRTYNYYIGEGNCRVINSSNISLSPPNSIQPCNLFTLYNSYFYGDSGNTYSITGIPLTGSGNFFYSRNAYVELGAFNSYSASNIGGFCDIDALTYINISGSSNSIAVTAPTYIAKISGKSFIQDGATTTWNFNPVPSDGIVLKSGGMITTPAILHSGLLILGDLVDYVQYGTDPNYTRVAYDKRYTEKISVTALGNIPQGVTSNDIGPQGVTSTGQFLYVAKGKSLITNLTIRSRVATGVLLADSYEIYVNGIASGLIVSVVNSTGGSTDGSVALVNGDVVSIRVTTSIFSLAEDITMQFTVQTLE